MSALPASAAPGTGDGTTTNLLYSVNGGAWSETVTAQRGDTVTARLFYDTTKDSTVTGASLTTQIPDGFTYVPGSTRNVLAPGSDVATGAVSSETKAAAVADSVWSGDQLQVSPSAGFNGESNASQSGVLRNGVKRYLNLHQCHWNSPTTYSDRIVSWVPTPNGWHSAGSNVKNAADTAGNCSTDPASTLTFNADQSRALALDLLGNRYLNLVQCQWANPNDSADRIVSAVPTPNGWQAAHTGMANAPATAANCTTAAESTWALNVNQTAVRPLDLLTGRYVNLTQCHWNNPNDGNDRISALVPTPNGWQSSNTHVSNTAGTTPECQTAPPGSTGSFTLNTVQTAVLPLDTLDTARGQGFVEFAFTSEVPGPAQCGETVTEPEVVSSRQGVLNGAGTGSPSSGASVTLAEYVDEGEVCQVPVELVDDAASTVVDGAAQIDVTGNDTIPAGSSAVSVDATSAQGGSVVDNGDGTVTYTPAAGFVGTDTFTYRVTGPDGVERSATVTVTVTEDDEPAVPMVAGGFAAAGLLGAGLMGLRTVRSRKETV
ncbi:Ig-like domain-containing protein [Cellulosimicrobium protaetiae]